MMEIYINDGGEWCQVRVRNDDLWLKILSESEKAELFDRIGKGEIKVTNTNIIRKGH